jgi:hypothetical protein
MLPVAKRPHAGARSAQTLGLGRFAERANAIDTPRTC